MKKQMIWKSTFREIRQSFGRFFAILAIVTLGVGFFAGLVVAKPAMVKTASKYLEEQNFYDYRMLSTLGFEQEEVEFFRQQEDVEHAEGAVAFDILYLDRKGNEGVVKTHSITEEVNKLKVVEGRMPQNADECVVDANLFAGSAVGQTLKFSGNNEADDLEHFAYQEYTIVGVVQSPLYIQYERGNSSLGTGRVDGFVYLPYEGFDVDYYTEIYVKFADDFPLYAEEYDAYIDEKEAVWEQYTAEAADMRYQRIVRKAQDELADAREDYEKEKADAEAELADAKQQLEDAAEQLADGEQQLADAKQELADARTTVSEKEKELADAEQEIAVKEQELADGEQEIKDGISKWNDGKYQLDQAKSKLQEGINELEAQKVTLNEKEQEVLAGEAALNASQQELEHMQQELAGQLQELDQQEKALQEQYGDNPVPEELLAKIQAGRDEIAAGQAEIEAGLAQIAEKRLEVEAGKTAITQGREAIAAYEQEIEEGREETKAGDKSLANSWAEIERGQKELADGRIALEDAKQKIADGKIQLADARVDITEGEKTLAEKEQELIDAQQEYSDGVKEYEDGQKEFDEKIAEADEKLADAEQEIEDIEEPESYLLGRDTNIGYVCFENDSSIVAGIANVFPVFFFMVAALVCITTMSRMVEEQRTQIGTLKALGYSDGVIMSKYLFYSGMAAVIGGVAGFVAGTYFFPRVIWEAYGIMYRIDSLLYVFDWKLAVISLTVALLCSVGTTWLSCRVELGEVAAQLMRPKSPKAGKRVFLEYFPFIWRRMSFLHKVSFRNIFRYKGRLFMMVLGIGGCTALLIAAFGIEDSIADVASQQFEKIQIFDLNVVFSEAVDANDLAMLEQVTGVEEGAYLTVRESVYDLVTESGRKPVNLVVTDGHNGMDAFVDLHTPEGEEIAFPAVGEVVLSDKIADTYGLKVGDTITFQNEDMETITAKISGICQNFIYHYAYINNGTYQQETGQSAEFQNVYVNLAQNTDGHQISASLMKDENVTGVTVNRDTMERFSSMMASLHLIVFVVILCAAGLAFIVLYNLTNINITERIREIATIKVLGFRKKETASYVFRENMMLAFMGIVVGLLMGHFLHRFIMYEINIDMIAFDTHVRGISYVYSVLLTFVFTALVNWFMNRKLERISMTESLKSVD